MTVSIQTRILDRSAYSKAELWALTALLPGDLLAEQVGQKIWGKAKHALPASSVLRRLIRLGLVDVIETFPKIYSITNRGKKVITS